MGNRRGFELQCRTLRRLLENEEAPFSSLPGSVRNGDLFSTLLEGKILELVKSGAGEKVVVSKPSALREHLRYHCPEEEAAELGRRGQNVRRYRDSKSSRRDSYRLAFLRGASSCLVNGEKVIPGESPRGWQIDSLSCTRLLFVENLEVFMEEREFLSDGWTIFYPLGRIGASMLERIEAGEVLFAPDLDYAGLNEFARVKERFPRATLHVPPNYFQEAKRFGTPLKEGQKATDKLLRLAGEDPRVREVLDFLRSEGLFMEQEGYRGA